MSQFRTILFLVFFVNLFIFAQNNYINHKIEKGETLNQICDKYDVSAQEVLNLNPDAVSGIKEGAYLIIPRLAAGKKTESQVNKANTHEVLDKETLYGISKKYNTTVDELVRVNPELKNGLKSGQVIVIPNKNSTSIEKPKEVVKTETDNKTQPEFHFVKAGETKYGLAKKYGLTIQELEKLNPEIAESLPVDFKLIVKNEASKPIEKKVTKQETKIQEPVKVEKVEKVELTNNQVLVKKGMTLYSIAKENNVTVEELIAANPSLKDGLKEDVIINIPNKTKEKPKKEFKNYSTSSNVSKRIAILLPFNQIEKNNLETQLGKDKFLNMVTDYYLGIKVAIDSAKFKKMKHHVEFFDSNETATSSSVEELVNAGKLDNFDVIIGCFYPLNNDKLVKLLSDKPTVIVSPMRQQDTSYPTLVETMLSRNELIKESIGFFHKPENNLISIIDSKKTTTFEFFSIQNGFSNFKFEDKENFKTEELISALDQTKNNIIFFDSENLNFLIKINQLTNAFKSDGYKINIVAVDFHPALESDEVFEHFINNELIYISTYDNRDNDKTKAFDKNYRSKYKGMPNQFVFRGYDVALDVFERASQTAAFINTLDKPTQQLNTTFDYVKTSENGFKNKGFYIFQFNSNTSINQLN